MGVAVNVSESTFTFRSLSFPWRRPQILFLVNDHEPKVFELDILTQNPVRSDEHIHLSVLDFVECSFLFLG